MPDFRKRPVVIQAELVSDLIRNTARFPKTLPKWFADAWALGDIHVTICGISVPTLEGTMFADPEDMLICGVAGEIYPCKPGIFEQTYEAV